MNKERIQVLLDPETIKSLNKEAKEKSISVSAVIRQKVEAMIKFQEACTDNEFIRGNSPLLMDGLRRITKK